MPLREGLRRASRVAAVHTSAHAVAVRRDYLDYMASCRNEEFRFDGISVRLPDTSLLYLSLGRAVAPKAV